MKSWSVLHCGNKDGDRWDEIEVYEQPAWREIVGPLVYWIDLHKPRWFEPGNGRPSYRRNADGETVTFLWRLNLECYLGYDFHHDKRKNVRRAKA
jgi:hypothetical protein